ncbi:unnamed protein product, partial [Adineta steineri]
TLCRSDRLVGQVLGEVGTLPDIYSQIQITYFLLRRLVGVRTEGDRRGARVAGLTKNEILMVNIGSLCTGGRVVDVQGELAKIQLTNPVCTQVSEKVALSRRVGQSFRLIGWGEIRRGTIIRPQAEIHAIPTVAAN